MANVKLLVSEELLCRRLLRLGDDAEITGARMAAFGAVEFDVHAPAAPEGAVRMEPVYTRDPWDAPDPVRLTAIRWQHADGTWTRQDMSETE